MEVVEQVNGVRALRENRDGGAGGEFGRGDGRPARAWPVEDSSPPARGHLRRSQQLAPLLDGHVEFQRGPARRDDQQVDQPFLGPGDGIQSHGRRPFPAGTARARRGERDARACAAASAVSLRTSRIQAVRIGAPSASFPALNR